MRIDDLKASAPRTFDKVLIDLLVEIQRGQAPIVTPGPAPVPARYDDTQLRQAAVALESRLGQVENALAQVIAMAKQLEADRVELMAICQALDHRISSAKPNLWYEEVA